jgi:hypothetical protein
MATGGGKGKSTSEEKHLFENVLERIVNNKPQTDAYETGYDPTEISPEDVQDYQQWAQSRGKIYSPLAKWADSMKPKGYDKRIDRKQKASEASALNQFIASLSDIASGVVGAVGSEPGGMVTRREDRMTPQFQAEKEQTEKEKQAAEQKHAQAQLEQYLRKVGAYDQYRKAKEAYNRKAQLQNIQSENAADRLRAQFEQQRYQSDMNNWMRAALQKQQQQQSWRNWLSKQAYKQSGTGDDKSDLYEFKIFKGTKDYTPYHPASRNGFLPMDAMHRIATEVMDVYQKRKANGTLSEQMKNDVSTLLTAYDERDAQASKDAMRNIVQSYWTMTPSGQEIMANANSGGNSNQARNYSWDMGVDDFNVVEHGRNGTSPANATGAAANPSPKGESYETINNTLDSLYKNIK